MFLASTAKRIAIFAFFDKDGIVDAYIPTLIQEVGKHCAQTLIVVNGALTEDGKAVLAPLGELYMRDNTGYDVTAYKEGYLHLLQSGALESCDELLFFNQTIFGPLASLEAFFSKTNALDCDFWGLTLHTGGLVDFSGVGQLTEVPPHLQSYFFAVRRTLLHAPEFCAYWQALPVIGSYEEAIQHHEVAFTAHFTALGWQAAHVIDAADATPCTAYALMDIPLWMVREKNCPFCKRKNFLMPADIHPTLHPQWGNRALYHYMRSATPHALALALQNITRTATPQDVFSALCLCEHAAALSVPTRSTACVLWLTALLPSLFDALLHHLAQHTTVYLITVPQFPTPNALQNAVHITSDTHGLCALFTVLWGQVSQHERLVFLDTNQDLQSTYRAMLSLCDFETNEATLANDENIGILTPFPITTGDCTPPSWNANGAALAAFVRPIGKVPDTSSPTCPDCTAMFYTSTALCAPLATLHWQDAPSAILCTPKALVYALPTLCAHLQGKLHCSMLAPYHEETLVMLYESRRKAHEIFATPKANRDDLIIFRMQGIVDFFEENRHALRLDDFTAPETPFKQKIWAILRILLGKERFEKHFPSAPTPPDED